MTVAVIDMRTPAWHRKLQAHINASKAKRPIAEAVLDQPAVHLGVTTMSQLITQYGYVLVFANVLIQQMGVPLPVLPTLVIAGALAAGGQMSAGAILGLCLLAAALSDSMWYLAGRRHGACVLRLLSRFTRKPAVFVARTEQRFARWGVHLLLVAKFVPGLSLVMPSLAGSMEVRFAKFLALDLLGAALWAGSAIGLGMLLHYEVDATLARLQHFQLMAATACALALLAVIAAQWWRHQRSNQTIAEAGLAVWGEAPAEIPVAV